MKKIEFLFLSLIIFFFCLAQGGWCGSHSNLPPGYYKVPSLLQTEDLPGYYLRQSQGKKEGVREAVVLPIFFNPQYIKLRPPWKLNIRPDDLLEYREESWISADPAKIYKASFIGHTAREKEEHKKLKKNLNYYYIIIYRYILNSPEKAKEFAKGYIYNFCTEKPVDEIEGSFSGVPIGDKCWRLLSTMKPGEKKLCTDIIIFLKENNLVRISISKIEEGKSTNTSAEYTENIARKVEKRLK